MGAQDQLQQVQRAVADDQRRQLEQAAIWSRREHELTSALADAEKRLRAIKADGVAARIFVESEDIDGKGASLSSIPAAFFFLVFRALHL